MSSTINVPASLIADAMGIVLLICVFFGNRYIIKGLTQRNKFIVILMIITICACILDAISAVVDGKNHTLVLLTDTLLYLCGPITSVSWIFFIAKYMQVSISKFHKIIVVTFFSVGIGLIILNMFVPILFVVNEYNIYERVSGLYLIYAISYFGLMIDAVVLYLLKKYESGGLKFFPMWAYVVPIGIGMIIQNLFFGVSAISPFMAIAITIMIISFQNNLLFRDHLTDLYNRYFLSVLDKKFFPKSSKEYSVIMLDVNNFKKINDILGHDMGDEALVNLSKILISTVDKLGEVIRYAGDEFVIILNSHDDAVTEAVISKINNNLQEFNNSKTTPYELSIAIGWCKFKSSENRLNDVIIEADKLMYINKQEYHKNNLKHNEK